MNILLVGEYDVYKLIDFRYLFKMKIYCHCVFINENITEFKDVTSFAITKPIIYRLEKYIKKKKIDRIVCFNEMDIEIVASIRTKLGINGLSEKESHKFRQKDVMTMHAQKYIETLPTIRINSSSTYGILSNLLTSEKLFIKPVDLQGTQNTHLIKSKDDFNLFREKQSINLEKFIVQPYEDSAVYHSEVLIENNRIKYLSARMYSITYPEYLLGKKPIFSIPILDKNKMDLIKKASENVAIGFGIKSAYMHTEFFIKDNNPVFIETCIRPPGMRIDQIHAKKLNISPETCMVLMECNETIGHLSQDDKHYICGWFPCPQGKVKSIEALNISENHDIKVHVEVGNTYLKPVKIRAGVSCIVWSDSFEKIMAVYSNLKTKQPIHIDSEYEDES